MRLVPGAFLIGWLSLLLFAPNHSHAQIALPAAQLILKSAGQAVDDSWKLSSNGYVGTYLYVPVQGQLSVTIRASGQTADTIPPHMNIVLNDIRKACEVSSRPADYILATIVPAGMHFLRIEFVNSATGRTLTIHRTQIHGASVVNDHTDANALAVADTYIENFRKGQVTVALSAVAPGSQVRVRLRRHAFNFGAAVPGFEKNLVLLDDPPPDSDADRFQKFFNSHFNMLVPENAGKWGFNEKNSDVLTMDHIDAMLRYAKNHNLRVRMHTLLWSHKYSVPEWVNELLDRALAGDQAAKSLLRQRISRRIEYYVRDRADRYDEIDVINEIYHERKFLDIFGIDGLADIFRETAKAAAQAGAHPRLYINEYNLLQWSRDPVNNHAPDPYANWYRKVIEDLRNAGAPVDGVGVQYYCSTHPDTLRQQPHSPARILQVMQNLSVLGLPITLTEFGVKSGPDQTNDPEMAAVYLEQTMRMIFGTPQATGFLLWGFRPPWMWEKNAAAALLDENWNLTPAGRRYEQLISQWNTDLTLTVNHQGTISFTAFWGDYDLIINGRKYPLSLVKGLSHYSLDTSAPAAQPDSAQP